jgi:D-glycero-alpha-D-manno-heptose-7-phosphate kinase
MSMAISRTPYRVSFFGGGTDYPSWFLKHGGAVLSMAINKYCYISGRYLPSYFGIRHRIVWSHIETVESISEILHPAVRAGLISEGFDDIEGVELHHQGDLPARTGIGSSSAFSVGLINVLRAMRGKTASAQELARAAIDLEQNKLQENGGCQDQIASAFGGLNVIRFERDGAFDVTPVALDDTRRGEFERRLMLFHTNGSRLSSEFAKTLVASLDANTPHLNRMQGMVPEALALLHSGDFDAFGHLLHENWTLKRQLTNGISSAAIDQAYEAARRAGALGGKLLGAGSTGFMVFVVPPERQSDVRRALSPMFSMPIQVDFSGSTIVYKQQD